MSEIIEQIKDLFKNDKLDVCRSLIYHSFNSEKPCKDPETAEFVMDFLSSTYNYYDNILDFGKGEKHYFFVKEYLNSFDFPLSNELSKIKEIVAPFSKPNFLNRYDEYTSRDNYIIGWIDDKENSESHLLDMDGNVIYKSEFIWFNSQNTFLITKGDKKGVINDKGEIILPVMYDLIYSKTYSMFAVELNGKAFFVDELNKSVFDEVWEEVNPFLQGFAFVKKNKKWGLIYFNGDLTIDYKFQEVSEMLERKAIVKFKNHLHTLKISGELNQIEKSQAELTTSLFGCQQLGIYTIKDGKNYYLVNQRGETLCEDFFTKDLLKDIE